MKLKISNNIEEYPRNIEGLRELMDRINEEMKDNNGILDHLLIDGSKVYSDFPEYIFDNIRDIDLVEPVYLSFKDFIGGVMVTTMDYLEGASNNLKLIISRKNLTEGDLDQLLEAINWLIESFMNIDKNFVDKIDNRQAWNVYAGQVVDLGSRIPNLVQLRQNKDDKIYSDLDELANLFKNMNESIIDIISQR